MRHIMLKATLILLVVHLGTCGVRFADEEMMKKHHNHQVSANADPITVHLIPHSHDDVGWLKTVDDYYYGGSQNIQWAGVQYTIDTVVQQLTSNPEYKFTIVEVAFLYRWWNQATKQQQQNMRKLVQNKQLVFINGGWCMSDQATPYYEDFIDQMTIGLRWLKETFDYVPQVAWHIDPFGHQAASASMFSKMGFQAFFFSRIDYQDKELRLAKKGMEMIWKPSQYSDDSKNYIFTHVNYYHYSPPPGFCFDVLCRDQPIKDDPTLEDYNLVDKSTDLANYFKSMALHFRTPILMHTLGEDFHFANARMWYKNFDKLIKFINSKPQYGVKLMYSTPTDYIKDLHQKHGDNTAFPTKTDDFFPYADHQNAYWTGYFTSRTAVKGFVRDFGRWLQAARKHIAQLKISGASTYIKQNAEQIQKQVWGMQMAMGILQHHDAVAGTQKQKVADDYVATGLRSIQSFQKVYRQIKKQEMAKQIGQTVSSEDLRFNVFWNNSAQMTGLGTILGANKTALLNLYNPGSKGTYGMRIRVPPHEYTINSPKVNNIQGDVICPNLKDSNDCQLVFDLEMEASSNNYVKITAVKSGGSAKEVKLKSLTALEPKATLKISDTSSLTISKTVQTFGLVINGKNQTFQLGYNYYDSYQGDGQKSGAYIFRPASNTPKTFSNIKTWHYADGAKAVYIVLQGQRTQTKVYFSKRSNYVESYGFQIESFIDSIPVNDKQGKQVVLTYASNYVNNDIFYTDSNGLEQQRRKLNYRPTWPLVINEPVSGNYYPINSHISLIDNSTGSQKKLTIVTDRSQGGSVIREGMIEIMVQRRTTYDDARGVGQPLNEQQPNKEGLTQSMRHWVVFGDNHREVQRRNDQKIMVTFVQSSSSTYSKHEIRTAPVNAPENVKLFLRAFTDGTYLLRLHNMDSKKENTVDLNGWDMTEYTMGANILQEDWAKNQFQWKEEPSTYQIAEQFEQERSKGFMKFINDMIGGVFSYLKNEFIKFFNGFFGGVSIEPQNDNANENIRYEGNGITLKPFQIRTFKIIKSQA